MLLINKTRRNFDVSITGAAGGQLDYVDVTTAFKPPDCFEIEFG